MKKYILVAITVALSLWSCDSIGQRHDTAMVGENFGLADIPDYYVIAGDTVDLRSYENRERLDLELCSFRYSHINTTLSIKRANRYFPLIERILKEEGIPDDMKYLAVVESSLNPMARSYAGAAGMWQFMEGTARDFGMKVDKYVDERYNIEKATRCACRYFRQAYAKFGDWLSVAASYNAGQADITRFRNSQYEEDPTGLWLANETSRYMFRLIAVKIIFSNPERFGFSLKASDLYPQLDYRVIRVDSTINSLGIFARNNGITYYQLKDANPWLRSTSLKCENGEVFYIKVPKQESMQYVPEDTEIHNPSWVVE